MYCESPNHWWQSIAIEATDPEFLENLAQWCERLEPGDERKGFDRVLREVGEPAVEPDGDTIAHRVARLVDVAAYESAAIAMIPLGAVYSGGRMKDGSFVAQVIPDESAGAHSRQARSLAMALLAALLRAMARLAAEAKAA